MGHEPIILSGGCNDPHAYDNIPIKYRPGDFDEICPTCKGHGYWNIELHGHGRVKTEGCHHCFGCGWLETNGATPIPDIILGPHGLPMWITRWVPLDQKHYYDDPSGRNLIK